jgi:LuxR family transcriptional regulator, maltose regulon positive regulatory protein
MDSGQTRVMTARRLGLGLLELQRHCFIAVTDWAHGDYRAAAAAGSAACKAAALGGWEDTVWAARGWAVSAHSALMRARPRQALRAAEQGLRAACTADEPVVRLALRTARGGALSDTGDAPAGLLELQQARAELGDTDVPGQLATMAALLEHRAALSSRHLPAAAAATSWLSERGGGQLERTLMSAWTHAAIGVRRTARSRVDALLAQPDPTRLPSTAVDAALFETAEALRDGNRAAARRDLHVALRRAEELDAVRPFAVADADVRSFLADEVRDLANRSAFAYRAVLSDPRIRLPHSTRLGGRQRDVLDQLSSTRNLD